MSTGLGEVILYRAADGGPALDVRLERESIWLTQVQMAELFGVNVPAIFKHIKNIYATGEFESGATVSKMEIVRQEGRRKVRRAVDHYNLDMVISVGYRVNSLRGTQFRIWATNVLRQHLVQGYTVHEQWLKELNQAVRLVAEVAHRRTLSGDEATALLEVVADYAYALEVLDDYDHQRVRLGEVSPGPVAALALDEAPGDRAHGGALRRHGFVRPGEGRGAGRLAGGRDADFRRAGGPSQPGRKGGSPALLPGGKRIADNALVAMTLLIAESRPDEKDVLTRVVVNLINQRNP